MLQEPETSKPIWEGLRGPGLGKVLSGHVSRTSVTLSSHSCTSHPQPACCCQEKWTGIGILTPGRLEGKRRKGVKVREF